MTSRRASCALAAAAIAAAALAGAAPAPEAGDLAARYGGVHLDASAATIHGPTTRFLVLDGIGNICCWTDAHDWISWRFALPAAGRYAVELRYSCQNGSEGSAFEVAVGDARLEGRIARPTGIWYDHQTVALGELNLARAGTCDLSLKPLTNPGGAVMNLVWLRLVPTARFGAYREAAARQAAVEAAVQAAQANRPVYVVPCFHPASCGWLVDFSTERNHCAYSYLAHLDRVRDDPTYAFALSEVNNIIAIMAFEPGRVAELRRRMAEGRVELVNAFFLEPTINLSGGEALVKMGVEGLRWQRQVMGARPRVAWTIDVTGVHEQMGQIVPGLGLDGMVYTRDNPTGQAMHWLEAPDGSRALCLAGGGYADWGQVFNTPQRLSDADVRAMVADARARSRFTPLGAPVLILGGGGDYSLPPAYRGYPAELLAQWKAAAPERELRFTTLSRYLDAVVPGVRSGRIKLPTTRAGARMTWSAFWVTNPRVKGGYRRAEHALQAAEAVCAAASLSSPRFSYPVQPLYRGWLQMLLNMDRNTLWGAAAGKVYESRTSWDVKDRLAWVDAEAARASADGLRGLLGRGTALGVFSACNWPRTAPVDLRLPEGRRLRGVPCQAAGDGGALYRLALPSFGVAGLEVEAAAPPAPKPIAVPATVETQWYAARVDPATGELTSLRLKPSGRDVLGGPVRLVAEKSPDYVTGEGHYVPPRPDRPRIGDAGQFPARVSVTDGPLAVTVEAAGPFVGGSACRRLVRFYRDCPRVDFEVELRDIPNATVVVAEAPLAGEVREARRGIPYGFSRAAWSPPNPKVPGSAEGIQPAIRWSHYQMDGRGVAILDRGLPGRELSGRTPVLFLDNVQSTYLGLPNAWTDGRGAHHYSFALLAHEGDFRGAGIARAAWEYNSPAVVAEGVGRAAARSLLTTSDNVVVEALRREGADVQLRMVECVGEPGVARLRLNLPHGPAALTDLTGARARPLPGGPEYRVPVRPQQIVTVRWRAPRPVEAVQPLLKWDDLVPPGKLAALRARRPWLVGFPGGGGGGLYPELPADAGRSLIFGRPATATNVYRGMTAHDPDKALDGDETSRWATDDNVSQVALDVDLGAPTRIGRAWLAEAYDRVRAFELQYQAEDGRWVAFAHGGRIGLGFGMEFEPVTARRVRLSITDAPGGPTIWEFMLFPSR